MFSTPSPQPKKGIDSRSMEQQSLSQQETLAEFANSSDLDEEESLGDVVEDFARQVEALTMQEPRWKDHTVLDDEKLNDTNGKEADEDVSDTVSDTASWGYQVLTQDEDGFEEEDEHEDNRESSVDDTNELSQALTELDEFPSIPVLPPAFKLTLSPTEKIPDSDLAVINSVMSKFKLPDGAIPGWAHSIPESAWLPRANDGEFRIN